VWLSDVFGILARSGSVSGSLVAVIDDDEALCLSIVDLLRSTGYRAEPFTSAETFLTSSDISDPDCIVADVHMPGMGGLNLVRELRKRRVKTPVILITALPDEYIDHQAHWSGARFLLRKPFEADSLLNCIAESLANKRRER
jgi:FixJ family two-component response regulator